MPLQVDLRPTNLDDFAGNEALKESLISVLERENPPHSFLFTGPSGCGKTTLAKIVGKMLDVSPADMAYFNASNTRGIETARAIEENSKFASMSGGNKLYILDECHQITGPAQESLLALLEEPPSHAYFVLCTTEPNKLKPTIKRRCHQYDVEPLTRGSMLKFLKATLTKIDREDFSQPVLRKILSTAGGSPGQALKLLDSVLDMTDEKKALEAVQNFMTKDSVVLDLCRVLADSKNSRKVNWQRCQKILENIKDDTEQIRYAILGYLAKIMVQPNCKPEIYARASNFTESFIYSGKVGLILACYLAFDQEEDIPF